MLKMDGFDDCVAGVMERIGMEPIICYNKELIIQKLMDDDMTEDDAIEHFEYNMIGSWLGEATPCFLVPYNSMKELEFCEDL